MELQFFVHNRAGEDIAFKEVLSMKYLYYIKKFWLLYLLVVGITVFATIGAEQTVTVIAENSPILRTMTIVIDAGHGGVDGGAISCSGIAESAYNLQIALKLRDLCHLLGYKTLMIRTTDESVYTEGNTIAAKKVSDLKQRVRTVNQTQNALLISIHQNFFPDSRYSGAQVFYNSNTGANGLAESMQRLLVNIVNPGSNRKCKEAEGVYLMQQIKQPGILVECGFLSNPQEEALLRDPKYQQKICAVIVSALSSYRNT